MTEVERIIESGRISADFLKEETKCGFFVDKHIKKIQMVELDLLMEFDRVCKKHGLRYWVGGGTLLGAIRHKGFIPWDDDIDVNMMREDYDKLMEIGPQEFKEPYFLQNPYTDDGFYFSYTALRNSNTSAIIRPFMYQGFNQGMKIDIMPYDNCRLEDVEERYNRINSLILDNSAYMRKSQPDPSEEDKIRIQNHSGRNPLDVYEEMVSIAKMYEHTETGYVNNAISTLFKCKENVYKKSAFTEFVRVEFDGFSVPVPKEYDYALKVHYGDYMQLPPIENRVVSHSRDVIDPDIPYKELLKKLR